ncbi:MAG TPA: hypothetical protein DCZ62_04670 [Ruminococcus sp.]|nr:hypothetical protein [Ruminococcus sp.]
MLDTEHIFPLRNIPEADVPVVLCFGHAGSYSGIFRDWMNNTEEFAFVPVEIPRRLGDLRRIAERVADRASELLWGREYCVFGHSMGAALAFETECILESRYGLEAENVFVCSRHSPDVDKDEFFDSSMSDERLILELKRLGGTDEEVFSQKEYRETIIPFIRNDYRIHESFQWKGERLRCSLEADLGMDDVSVSISDISGWRNMTEGEYKRKLFNGGHFFLYDDDEYFEYLKKRCCQIFGARTGQICLDSVLSEKI